MRRSRPMTAWCEQSAAGTTRSPRPAAVVAAATLLVLGVGAVAVVAPTSAAPTVWEGSGPGATTVVSNGSDSNPQFRYALNPAGFLTRTWTFSTTAATSGPTTLDYDYRGFHAYYRVTVFLRAFVVRNGTTTTVPLVSDGPRDCCTPPSGGFAYTGTTTLDVLAGDRYGFEFGGSNFDRDNQLNGTLVVSLQAPVATTLTADPPVQGVFTLRARLTTADGAPVPGQTIVMSTSAGEVCRATTDAGGVATCSGLASAAQIAQEGGYTATFAGTSRFAPSTARASLLTGGTTQTTTSTTSTTTTSTTSTTTTTQRREQLPATGGTDGTRGWGAALLLAAAGFGVVRSALVRRDAAR